MNLKPILLLFLVFSTIHAEAQSINDGFPYNPDFDGDSNIGSPDLLAFLSVYSTDFVPLGLSMNEDSTIATVDLGSLNYMECMKACNDLAGNWKMTTFEDVASVGIDAFSLPTFDSQGIWIQFDQTLAHYGPINLGDQFLVNYLEDIYRNDMVYSNTCGCALRQAPKVEYSYCEGTNIQSCAETKVADGWYPLGGISYQYQGSGGWNRHSQAFWRWAE